MDGRLNAGFEAVSFCVYLKESYGWQVLPWQLPRAPEELRYWSARLIEYQEALSHPQVRRRMERERGRGRTSRERARRLGLAVHEGGSPSPA